MKVCGLDFTSAPTSSNAKKQKRLLLAVCNLDGQRLDVQHFQLLNTTQAGSFAGFEEWLTQEDSWIAGLDFPFAQPAALVKELNWGKSWSDYVSHIAALGKNGFEQALVQYKASKAAGHKHLFREIDKRTDSQSPMTLDYTPVGKMFFQGSYRLLQSNVSLPPLRPITGATKVALEAYPALVARKWIGLKQGYKNDDPKKSDQNMTHARRDIVSAIRGMDTDNCRVPFMERYGFNVVMTDDTADQCVKDHTGDMLDSVLCAAQAAWAYTQRARNYGIPEHVDPLEGWICDPETLQI